MSKTEEASDNVEHINSKSEKKKSCEDTEPYTDGSNFKLSKKKQFVATLIGTDWSPFMFSMLFDLPF